MDILDRSVLATSGQVGIILTNFNKASIDQLNLFFRLASAFPFQKVRLEDSRQEFYEENQLLIGV